MPVPRLQRTYELTFAPCAGTAALGELTGGGTGQPPGTPSPVVACRSRATGPARAVRWTGSNRADIEALTGRTVADSLCTERAILVDAWGTPQVCPDGHWVVVAETVVLVLSPGEFFAGFKIDRPGRVAKEAA